MAQKDRTTLKQFFQTGDIPSEQEYAHLIDSKLNLVGTDVDPQVINSSIQTLFHVTASGNISSSATGSFNHITYPAYSASNGPDFSIRSAPGSVGTSIVKAKAGIRSYSSPSTDTYLTGAFDPITALAEENFIQFGSANSQNYQLGKNITIQAFNGPVTMSKSFIAPSFPPNTNMDLPLGLVVHDGILVSGSMFTSGSIKISGSVTCEDVIARGSATFDNILTIRQSSDSVGGKSNKVALSAQNIAGFGVFGDLPLGQTQGSTLLSHGSFHVILNASSSNTADNYHTSSGFFLHRANNGQGSATFPGFNSTQIFGITAIDSSITASGNISIAGDITSSATSNLTLGGNITALGTGSIGRVIATSISSSGVIEAGQIQSSGSIAINALSSLASDVVPHNVINYNYTSPKKLNIGNSFLTASILGKNIILDAPVTASSNISASGTIIANQFSGSSISTGSFGSLKIPGESIDFSGLPTSDPGIEGRLWQSGSTDVSPKYGVISEG